VNEHVVPSAVAQRHVIKFLTNGNVKPDEILTGLRAQLGDEMLSMTQVYDWSESLKEGRTEVETCEDYILCRESYDQRFWDPQGILFVDLLKERTINAA
jgi:hypothetical protein